MKELLIAVVIVSGLNAYGQGQGVVSFTSVGARDDKKIQDQTGAFCSGIDYRVALYWGAATETDERNLTQIGGSTAFLTTISAGTYFGGGRTITTPDSPVNGPVLAFQVRAWTAAHGATYEEAFANPAAFAARTPIFTLKTKDPNNALETTPNLYQADGYIGFRLTPIPEPSVFALRLLGAGGLLARCRRK
jgi:hypothetical protein